MSTQKRDTVIKQEDEELTAASALACLARDREPERVGEEPEQNQEEDDDDSFIVPQRFTKSGRKRAVPFVIKVRGIWQLCCFVVRACDMTERPAPVLT